MDEDVKKGLKPMKEEHVWWLVNPSSQSAKSICGKDGKRAGKMQGTKDQGIKLSVIAGYMDPDKVELVELPLTRSREIWGASNPNHNEFLF